MTLTTAVYFPVVDPAEEQIWQLLVSLPELAPEENYFVLEASEESTSYMQGRPEVSSWGTYRLECRDGEAQRHFLCWVDSATKAYAIVCDYLRGGSRWRQMADWKDISHSFPDLRAAGRDEIPLESDFFDPEEWAKKKALEEERLQAWDEVADDHK